MQSGKLSHMLTFNFNASKICKSATILLLNNIHVVFPLFGPIKEMLWAEGWEPQILHGNEEDVQERMVFRTKASNDQEEYFQWVVTRYDALNHSVEYMVSAKKRIWFINVECKTSDINTLATITYTYIGLTAEGHQRNCEAIKNMFAHELSDWEEAINYYLKTGKKIRH